MPRHLMKVTESEDGIDVCISAWTLHRSLVHLYGRSAPVSVPHETNCGDALMPFVVLLHGESYNRRGYSAMRHPQLSCLALRLGGHHHEQSLENQSSATTRCWWRAPCALRCRRDAT